MLELATRAKSTIALLEVFAHRHTDNNTEHSSEGNPYAFEP